MRALSLFLLASIAAAPASAACSAVSGYGAVQGVTLAKPTANITLPVPFTTDGSNLADLKTAMQAAMQADGDDVRFTTEGGTNIPYTFVRYDSSTGSLQAFLGPIALTTSADTVVCVSFGNAGAASGSSATPLADYELVLTADSTTDLTGNGHTATLNSVTTTSGPWATSWVFNADADYVSFANSGAAGEMTNEVYSLTVLFESDSLSSATDRERIVDRDSTTDDWPVMWMADSFIPANAGGWFSGGGFDLVDWEGGSAASVDTWYHVSMVRDRTTDNEAQAFRDGVLIATDSGLTANATPNANLTLASLNSSFGWQGSVGVIMWRNDDDAGSAAWQAWEYAAFLSPDSVFSLAGGPKPISIWSFTASLTPPLTSTLCASAQVDLGAGACPAADYGLHILMGEGR